MRGIASRGRLGLLGALAGLFAAGCSSEVQFASAPRQDADEPEAPVEEGDATGETPVAKPTPPPVEEPADDEPADDEVVDDEEDVTPPTTRSVQAAFPAARLEDQAVKFEPEFRRATQDLTLVEAAPVQRTLQQASRLLVNDSRTQGHDGASFGPETFSVSSAGVLDLLVVVDDSTSMGSELQNLATKIDPLLSKIGNTEWRIAVVTTSDPCLRNNRIIAKGDADAAAAFEDAVLVTLDPTVVEYGFPMAIRALKGECGTTTTPWLRPNSTIGVLILSDEENCGSNAGEGCPGMLGETPQQMLDYLASIRAAGMARIYGLIEGANECGSAAYTGAKYKQAIEASGGVWGSICQNDYTTTLQAISDNVSRIVKREFPLTHLPDSTASLIVSVDGAPVTSGLVLSGKVLTIPALDPTKDTLSVSYTYGATPKSLRFRLSTAPDESTLGVTVNGAVAGASDWTYDSTTQDVVFNGMPPDDAALVLSYRKAGALPKRISLASVDVLGTPLAVTVDGAAADWSWDAAAKALVFAVAPLDGVAIDVTHRTAAGRQLRYPAVLADLSDVDAVKASDAASGDPIGVTLDGTDLVIEAAAVTDGRAVTVRYDLGYLPDALRYDLGVEPVDGSVVVTASAGALACAQDVQVIGAVVTFACEPKDVGEVTVAFQTVGERFEDFTLPDDVPEGATWTVTIDGAAFTDFTREGRTVHIDAADLMLESTVLVRAVFEEKAP